MSSRVFSRPRSGQNENSPAIYRWESRHLIKIQVREADGRGSIGTSDSLCLSRPFHGLYPFFTIRPSTEVLGYCQSSASRTNTKTSELVDG
jgi:hypothetical protein